MSDRIKVFYLIERIARAGTELHLAQVINRLDRERFDPVLCCLNGEMTEKELVPDDVPVHLLDAGWNLLRPHTLKLYRDVRRLLRSEKPTILHTFLFVANTMGPFAARATGVPGVIASRGRMGIEWQANPLHHLIQRAADRRTDRLACKTEAMRREISRIEKVPIHRIRVIPNGVDALHFTMPTGDVGANRVHLSDRYGIDCGGPLLVAVGNLKPIKDHATLIGAMPDVTARFPNVRLAIVGKGESQDALWKMIRERSLERNVFLPGSSDDVREWLRAADLFVAPSKSEGMPNALLEAMASGLAPVLSDIPGHHEAAREAAWYFRVGDDEDLARKIIAALASPQERARHASAARMRVENELSITVMARHVEALYDDLLLEKGLLTESMLKKAGKD